MALSRRILAMVIVLMMILASLASCAEPEAPFSDAPSADEGPSESPAGPGPVDPPEGVTSLEMARLMGYGINLGNTMEACDARNRIPNRAPSVYEQMWGNPITTQEMVTGMRDAGFKTLRVPVAWSNAMAFAVNNEQDYENWDYTIDQAYLDRVEEIVNYALNEDMFVIINAHWDHGWWSMFGHPEQEARDVAMEIFTSMWTQIAGHFEGYDERLIFEPSNEEWGNRFNDTTPFSPTGGVLNMNERYELLTELSQVFVDLIRSSGGHNPDRFLLMKGFNTDVERTVDSRFRMPEDPRSRLMLSVHYYTPWSYCGDTSGVGTWGRTGEVEEMNRLLGSLTQFTDMGYGVVLGEWGVLDNEGDDRLNFFTNFLDNCDLYGFAPILWDTGYDPIHGRLFNRRAGEVHTIVAPELLALFQSRDVSVRAGLSAEDIMAAARDNMAVTMEMAINRPETVISADEAFAWIMFTGGNWFPQYSAGDRYQPENISAGLVPTDVEITGPGTYTVALDFTGLPTGYSNGFEFAAIGIINGEILFPGYYIHITSLLINGEEAEFAGLPYTTNDNPVTTRVNLYNDWVGGAAPPDARVYNGTAAEASPTFLENYRLTRIATLEITFEYIAP